MWLLAGLVMAPALCAADLESELKQQVDVVWAGLLGRSVSDYVWRDKTSFGSAYETARDESASSAGELEPDELPRAIAMVRELADTNRKDPHYQWRVHALLAQMLAEHGGHDEARSQMQLALAAYPDEDYAEPDLHSSYQHLVNMAADWIWDQDGVAAAERFALEHFANDRTFTFFYLGFWEQRYHDSASIERLGPLIDAVESAYSEKKKAYRRRRKLYDEYADALSNQVVAIEHTVDGDARQTYYLISSRELKRTAHRDLVLVLPGGGGHAPDDLPWLMGLARKLHDDYIFAVISAPKWSEDQTIAWVSEWWMESNPKATFSSEQLIQAVYGGVRRLGAFRVDHTYLWGWSSAGPAVYSAALEKEARYDGAYINSSVYRPERLDFSRARSRRFYLQQGREDTITAPSWAELAAEQLGAAHAKVKLDLIDGGHGFGKDPLGNVRAALEWLGKRK
jgi:predicted esterase